MKVLTYVDGIITVINGDNYFNGKYEKPSFITGISFYYEPTQFMMDNVELDDNLKQLSKEYIENFTFQNTFVVQPELMVEEIVVEPKSYVDSYGNIFSSDIVLGNVEKFTEIEHTKENYKKYDLNKKSLFDFIVIELSTLKPVDEIKYVNESNADRYKYVDRSSYDNTICSSCQKFNLDTESFEPILQELKSKKIGFLSFECMEEIKKSGGDLGNGANAVHNSWLRQETEAEAYKKDNTSLTPFIDNIIIGRNLNENKDEFINKILEKANSYKVIYGQNLGKLSAKIKEIENATTKDEIINIVW